MSRSTKPRAPRVITLESICTIKDVAAFLGLGRGTIYKHMGLADRPYELQYPRIRRTTPAHYLAWTAQATSLDTIKEDQGTVSRREREKCRLRSAVDKSRAPKSSRD